MTSNEMICSAYRKLGVVGKGLHLVVSGTSPTISVLEYPARIVEMPHETLRPL